MQEKDLIPYASSELPNGPWLVFAPHPDDETFGMGGTILLAQQAGIAVDIVFITDGGRCFGGNDRRVADLRAAEAEAACAALSVRAHEFWDVPDRGLVNSIVLQDRVIRAIKTHQPRHIFVPSYLEFHPDHRATAQIVWDAMQRLPNCKAQLISYDITNMGPCNRLIDISHVLAQKRQVMELYKSQVAAERYIELVEGINIARTFS